MEDRCMAGSTVEIQGFAELRRQIEALQTSDPAMRKKIQGIIRTMLRGVRSQLMNNAKSGLQMDSDPRNAYKAIRTAVYKRILGGQVNILQSRRAGKKSNYETPRKGLPVRGGNRWGRSERTVALESYDGKDRGFVLRFLNAGTDERIIRTYTDKYGEKHSLNSGGSQHIKTRSFGGRRGNIKARNWFGNKSQQEMENAAAKLQHMIDELIKQEFIEM